MPFAETDIPRDLIDRVRRRQVVPFVGAGLSVGAGLPNWPGLLNKMADWCAAQAVAREVLADVRQLIERSRLLDAAGILCARMGRQAVYEFLRESVGNPECQPTENHTLLLQLGFPCFLTTNYDRLIERAYARHHGDTLNAFTWQNAAALANAATLRAPYLLKVHGEVEDPGSIILSRADYRQLLFGNQALREYFRGLLQRAHLLLLGFSLTDPDITLLLDEIRTAFGGFGLSCYALLTDEETPAALREQYRQEWNLHVISYQNTPGHPEVTGFLTALRDAAQAGSEKQGARPVPNP